MPRLPYLGDRRGRPPWARALLGGALAVVVLVAVVLALRSAVGPPGVPLATRILGRHPYRPVFLAFYENASSPGADDGSLSSFRANARYVDLVAPYWYRVGNGGLIARDMHDPRVVRLAARHAVRVWPLVGNDGYGMITTPSARRTTVTTLLDLARRRGYDGIFVDFELLPPGERADFTTFVAELARAFHRYRLGVGVAVFPKVAVGADVQGVYDYPRLGRLADAVIVMTYDHHQNTSPPGAVAPLPWVRANMVYAASQIPKAKLFVGVGAYGYDWSRPGVATTVSTRQVAGLLGRLGVEPVWSEREQEPHFAYVASGDLHHVWYEDTFTFTQKLALARSLRLGGVSLWRLGYEEPSLWRALAREEGGAPVKPPVRSALGPVVITAART